MDLMLHAGGHHVAREALARCDVPPPSRTWHPIPHHRLLEQVEHAATDSNLSIVNEAHALARDGSRYFGLLEVGNENDDADWSLVLGLRNSHDQSFPAALAVGSGVLICDNLAFSGEVTLARKHTRHIERDLPQLVDRAVGRLGNLRDRQRERIDTYKQTTLDDSHAHDLMVRAVDHKVVPVTALPQVVNQWRQPAYDAFSDDGKTAWRLFNAFTEALKGRSLEQLPRRTQALHGLLDRACGVPGNAAS
jgi:hypothetical protein